MTMAPGLRKLVLTVHLTCSVGWIGAVFAYLALNISALTARDMQTTMSAWTAMEVIGWWVLVPLAVAALLTGLIMSLGTPWGLFRHYWVLISLVLTVFCTAVLVQHMVDTTRAMASGRGMGGDLLHPGAGLVFLLVMAAVTLLTLRGNAIATTLASKLCRTGCRTAAPAITGRGINTASLGRSVAIAVEIAPVATIANSTTRMTRHPGLNAIGGCSSPPPRIASATSRGRLAVPPCACGAMRIAPVTSAKGTIAY